MSSPEVGRISTEREGIVTNEAKARHETVGLVASAADGRSRQPLRVALFYDMDACKNPTGVTRHALGQIEEFTKRRDLDLRLVSGRITEPAGIDHWNELRKTTRSQLPIRTRNMLRWWRFAPWPPLEHWCGEVDWVYCPSEYGFPTRRGLRAVTSHDIYQNLTFGPPSYRERFGKVFGNADLILSVSRFNTRHLLEAYPKCEGRVAYVPNAPDDEFFIPASAEERHFVRHDLGLPEGMPYFLSVANYQSRKNLLRLIRAAARLPEIARGEIALVLLGSGDASEASALKSAAAAVGPRTRIRFPGYRHGASLRATYAESIGLVFPSLCESFGIPAVEAMAQGIPVALSNSTALPEIGGPAGWYFPPESEDAITATLRDLLDNGEERMRRVNLGREIAAGYRWHRSNELLVTALRDHTNPKS